MSSQKVKSIFHSDSDNPNTPVDLLWATTIQENMEKPKAKSKIQQAKKSAFDRIRKKRLSLI